MSGRWQVTLTDEADRDIAGSIARGEIASGLRTFRIARRERRASHVLAYRATGSDIIEVL